MIDLSKVEANPNVQRPARMALESKRLVDISFGSQDYLDVLHLIHHVCNDDQAAARLEIQVLLSAFVFIGALDRDGVGIPETVGDLINLKNRGAVRS